MEELSSAAISRHISIKEIEDDVDVVLPGESPAQVRINDTLTGFDRHNIVKIVARLRRQSKP